MPNQFKVRGAGRFPYDMLRYDACWPATQDDVSAMQLEIMHGDRSVTLSTQAKSAPTIGRWESFGWRVIEQ
jgi:hypothetical protein